MALFKCKMCGGALETEASSSVAVCPYCGTKQTLPRLDSDRRENLYDRANHQRRNNDFDKAAAIYEQILNEDGSDAEAYWSLVLCRYGVEYVEDPATHKRIPTVNRTQFTSIYADEDYKSAVKYADPLQREIYEAEAKAIDEIQKGILEISKKEDPFDIFICYKETDENGKRTRDSVYANEIYQQLTQEGYRVFYSHVTMSGRTDAYEPYIFSALNSAKLMIVVATNLKYVNSPWVKNEWSRFHGLMKKDKNRVMYVSYRDLDPYELPPELSYLNLLDLSGLGFMQDLVRNVKKQFGSTPAPTGATAAPAAASGASNLSALLKRVTIFLEDGDWKSADEYCEKVLDVDPENAQAYLGKLMAEVKVRRREELENCPKPFDESGNYQKVLRYAKDDLGTLLSGYVKTIKDRNEAARLEAAYNEASAAMDSAKDENDFRHTRMLFLGISEYKDASEKAEECATKAENTRKEAIYAEASEILSAARDEGIFQHARELFLSIPAYKDADEKAEECAVKAEAARKQAIYSNALKKMSAWNVKEQTLRDAAAEFQKIPGYKDADEKAEACLDEAETLRLKAEEAERKRRQEIEEAQRKQEELRLRTEKKERQKKRMKMIGRITAALVVVAVLVTGGFLLANKFWIIPSGKYNRALSLMKDGDYASALDILQDLDFKDSQDQRYNCAVKLLEQKDYDRAIAAFASMPDYKDCAEKLLLAKYQKAVSLQSSGNYKEALAVFRELDDYSDSADRRSAIVGEHRELAEVGDRLVFGSYEQDGNSDNGTEEILWYVLAKEEEKLYLISEYILDYRPYQEKSSGYHYDWKDCSLRKWLNETFYNAAFSPEEQALIVPTTVSVRGNSDKTTENVFLLGFDELDYLPRTEDPIFNYPDVFSTPYAQSLGAQNDGRVKWWLRDDSSGGGALYIYSLLTNTAGDSWSYENLGVRPVLWLDASRGS